MVLRMFGLIYLVLFFSSCYSNLGKVYYVDSIDGDDTCSGLSEQSSWKTLSRANLIQLHPGDQLLFKRGGLYKGRLEISASGLKEKRIVIGCYGDTTQNLPVIEAPDSSLYTVRIYNSDYLTIQDLEIVNNGSCRIPKRTGLKIECIDYGISAGIKVYNIKVRDVNGSLYKEEGGGSGILFVNKGDKVLSKFDNLSVEHCRISNCSRNAIMGYGCMDRRRWLPNTNLMIRNNLIEGVPGDGIVPIGCDSAIIEYNVMRDCPDILPANEAAAGIWPWSCDNTIIQFNQVSGHKAPRDAQGFDADYNCKNTVIQYNFSHDNDGGFVLVCNSGDIGYNIGNWGSVIKYNISIGDGIRKKITKKGYFSPIIHLSGPIKNTMISRNIIHSNVRNCAQMDCSMAVADDWNGYADSTSFVENIFYTASPSRFLFTKSTHNYMEGNWYLGVYKDMPLDKNAQLGSTIYQERILEVDNKGYKGLQQLMSPHRLCNELFYFVDKQKIEDFFVLTINEKNGINTYKRNKKK